MRNYDLVKSWVSNQYRGTTTFNTSGSLNVPYGRNKMTVSGRGGSGNAPTPAGYNTVPGNPGTYNPVTNYPYTPATNPSPPNAPSYTYVVNYPYFPGVQPSYNFVGGNTNAAGYGPANPGSYNTIPAGYNTVPGDPPSYNWIPAGYNTVPGNPNPGSYNTVDGNPGPYNPANFAIWQQLVIGPSYGGAAEITGQEKTAPDCGLPNAPIPDYIGSDYFYWQCFPGGQTQYNNPPSYPYTPGGSNSTNYPYTPAVYPYTTGNPTNYPYTPAVWPYTTGNYPYIPSNTNSPNYPYTSGYDPSYNTVNNYPYFPGTAGTPGSPASYNTVTNYPYTPGTPTNYPYTPAATGNPGTSGSALGVTFPGGSVGSVAPYVASTIISYYDYPDNVGTGAGVSPGAPAGYPITVPPGGYVIVNIE